MRVGGCKKWIALAGVGAVVAVAGCSSGGSAGSGGDGIVVANYGGDSAEAMKNGWLDPWSEETGSTYEVDSPASPAKITAMVDAGRVSWDVAELDVTIARQMCEDGYVVKRDPSVDISTIDPALITDDCGVPVLDQSMALVYNKDKFGDNPPTSITDFMNRDEFPGVRLMSSYPMGNVESLLLADGVDGDNMYPLDFDRVSSAVDNLGGDLVLGASLPDLQQRLENGDFAMCICLTARAMASAQNGANIGVVWDNSFSMWDGMYAIAKSSAPEAQTSFLAWLAKPENQAGLTKYMGYLPTTTDRTAVELDPEFSEFLRPENAPAVRLDAAWYADGNNANDVTEQWTAATTK